MVPPVQQFANVAAVPGVVVDKSIARQSGTTGRNIQGSTVTISDAGAVAGVTGLDMTGPLNVGTDNTVQGLGRFYGHTTGSPLGGTVQLYTGADYDGTIDYYSLRANEDDLELCAVTTPKLTYKGAEGYWSATANVRYAESNRAEYRDANAYTYAASSGNLSHVATTSIALTAPSVTFPTTFNNVTTTEFSQLETIGATTISAAQWGYLGAMDQGVGTGDSPTFAGLTLTGNITMPEDGWIGRGASAPRVVFDETGGEIEIRDANLSVGGPGLGTDIVQMLVTGSFDAGGNDAWAFHTNSTLTCGNGKDAIGFGVNYTHNVPVGETAESYGQMVFDIGKSGTGTISNMYAFYARAMSGAATSKWAFYNAISGAHSLVGPGTESLYFRDTTHGISSQAAGYMDYEAPTGHRFSGDITVDGSGDGTITIGGTNNIVVDKSAANQRAVLQFSTGAVGDWVLGTPDSDNFGAGNEFYIGRSVIDPKLVIDTAGNVGIGTTGPGAKLHVDIGATQGLVAHFEGGEGNDWENYISVGPFIGSAANSTILGHHYSSGDNDDYGYLGLYGNAQVITWDFAGNVGIGTTGPSSKLDVAGSIEIGSANYYYIGDPSTNDSWRFARSGDDLVFQRRETGVWVTKQTITP
jgi:hypothetical protein